MTSTRGWEYRKPGGVGDIEHSDTGFTTTVAIPVDADGYFGRECPSCAALFKMRHDEYRALPDALELTCPYCGHREDHGEFLTDAQRERVSAAAHGLAEQMVHSMFGDMLSDVFGHQPHHSSGSTVSVEWSYTPGSPPPVRELPPFVEDEIRRTIECSSCGNHYAVFSATSFCPVCGPRPAADKVIEAVTAARQSLALEDALPDDDRDQLRALGVFERLAVDAIASVVSLFELFAREQFHARVAAADDAVRNKGNVFQRLDDTAQLFMAHAGVDLVLLAGQDRWRRLKRAFAQRHVLTHRGGLVDQRYLDQVPDATAAIGQRLIIRRADAEQALDDLQVFVTALAAHPTP